MDELELYDAVGRVAVESAALEYELTFLLEVLLDSESGEVLAAGQTFGPALQMVREIIKFNWPPLPSALTAECNALLDEANRLYDARNTVVHGTWSVGWPDGPASAVRHRKWAKRPGASTFARGDVLRLAQDIQDSVVAIRLICPRISAERHPERGPFGEAELAILGSVWRAQHVQGQPDAR